MFLTKSEVIKFVQDSVVPPNESLALFDERITYEEAYEYAESLNENEGKEILITELDKLKKSA